jgi:glycosyltransferase involved in cell wall biosynthesis
MKASVVTPTYGRHDHLLNLVHAFKAQTYADKELLILDDSPQPATDIQRLSQSDPEIRYTHRTDRLSVGAKRNLLIEQARGEIIVQFDDDDYYAPAYIATVVDHLRDHDFFTLSGWYAYNAQDRFFYYWDTEAALRHHYMVHPQKNVEVVGGEPLTNPDRVHGNVWGYGFSYAFKRAVYPTVRFADENHGEDYRFVRQLADAGFKLHAAPDTTGLVLHLVHANSSSLIFPQYRLPSFLLPAIFGDAIFSYTSANVGSRR